jgi:orotate phosphoribosyltransferase
MIRIKILYNNSKNLVIKKINIIINLQINYFCFMTNENEVARRIVSSLLDIEAIKLNLEEPFTWASGWKSPIYCDNRLALSYPDKRDYIKQALADDIKMTFENTESIAGVATAGIPQGVLVADALALPFIYVRSKPKGHGLTNQIEGKIVKGQKVVVIEDLVSTGGSSIKAVEAIRDAGMQVLGMISIFTYGFDLAYENFRKADIHFHSLSDYNIMIEVAKEKKLIMEEQVERLNAWRQAPDTWN